MGSHNIEKLSDSKFNFLIIPVEPYFILIIFMKIFKNRDEIRKILLILALSNQRNEKVV